ncbi:MAG: glucose-1-phosphate thymidylyltransferase RfbA [Ignavibacteriaceae bacterium]|jgi:glucose-1-phosphate thymidylyltransferase|nr:glucose-1-phosphate thymidylyltransferase RfbA [Ignavibacteriaceae bacterium]MCW8813688.1 glucose-1-phosphate thymidylyltransferase RfbA [Chlorobium sp.]MCW8995755.1 glucose-1-phosphate thymidylyltransferase RfbA [Psychromonas sp.]MCW8818201.1 glucose-1-phosphate thymidylyltransferase RfbA [Ignavibacteriaceae bacterium]MCW8960698.1 glucose-1-phosphate thymidylyltransferase RfbA [Ignavibacteriaceae bacterium]
MKGIILAGGSGSRLYPITKVYSKQLATIYDKPLIYYPLSILMLGGVRDVLIISNEETIPLYQKLFGDGSHLGMKFEYVIQPEPKGIAQAFILGEKFIGSDMSCLILGDNIFYGNLEFFYKALQTKKGATIFGYQVNDPERYGIVEFDKSGMVLSIEEKPAKPKSHYAVPGLYIYDNRVIEISKNLKPSGRGELEITDVNRAYLDLGELRVEKIGRGIAWLDTGTPEALLAAANFFGVIEDRQGLKVACIEEIAYYKGFITKEQFVSLVNAIPKSLYKEYLQRILAES